MIRSIIAAAALSSCIFAQDSYWVASRSSSELHEITSGGVLLNVVNMGTSLRSAHVAPDGKVWVVRFIQAQMDIYDPATGTTNTITSSMGNPFDIAFDDQGTAWVSGGSGVEQFDANGLSLQTFPTAASPLGITIDSADNKWIAHRSGPPGSLTQIDSSGVVTNTSLPAASLMLPGRVIADFRGIASGNHIWIVGDRAAELVEYDPTTATFTIHTMPTSSLSSLAAAPNGDIWVGSFSTGDILQVDSTGAVVNNWSSLPNTLGLSFDDFGRLWSTSRVSFSGPQPSELRRIDTATGVLEVATQVGLGTQSPLSSQFQYAMVVDPFGDLDGDGAGNIGEILGGTSPSDPCSTPIISLATSGVTTTNSAVSLDVTVASGTFWAAALATGTVPPGSGFTVPGFSCEVQLDPVQALSGTLAGVGPTNLSIPIPNNPALAGFEVYLQGLGASSAGNQFSNVTSVFVWM